VEQHEVLHLREQVITLIRMDRLAASANVARRRFFVVVVALGDRKIGLVVDGMHGEEELVVKSFDDKLVATDLVSGASVLGDGRVVLILNLAAVAQRLAHFSVAAEQGEARKSASSGDLGVRP
jgi:two-component system chemotaxis sensor kinase CheA